MRALAHTHTHTKNVKDSYQYGYFFRPSIGRGSTKPNRDTDLLNPRTFRKSPKRFISTRLSALRLGRNMTDLDDPI